MPELTPDDLFAYAIRVLSARAYAEAALKTKLLKRAKGNSAMVEGIVERVKALGYLDDNTYAEGYARLYQGRWGAGKIRQQLRAKGVAQEVVQGVLDRLEPDTNPLAEAVRLLERYPSRYKGEKSKAIRFLANRGYTLGVALEAWEKFVLSAATAD
jgi:regulatory protein